jgi:hypothetical protein
VNLRSILGAFCVTLFLTASAVTVTAALVDKESLERGISANQRALLKARAELARVPRDTNRAGQLENKIVLLENDTHLKERRLKLYLLKAGDWMRLPDALRKQYLREAEIPADAMDDFTLHIMERPGDMNKPLENVLADQSFRYRGSRGKR